MKKTIKKSITILTRLQPQGLGAINVMDTVEKFNLPAYFEGKASDAHMQGLSKNQEARGGVRGM